MARRTRSTTVNHSKADKSVYRRELNVSETANGDTVSLSTNSLPLSSLVQSSSLRERDRYNWKTGEVVKEKMDVLTNAQAAINRHKFSTVTDAGNKMNKGKGDGGPYCSPCVPTIGGRY
jgi:hypothetical protein